MKLLIMSDSHGWDQEVKEVVERHRSEVDGIFHCGDSELSAASAALQDVQTVRGNCDMDHHLPNEISETVEGLRVFAAHGHLLSVKTTSMNLLYKADEEQADLVCFGHTHTPTAVQSDGTVLINPGSMRLPRQYPEGTYVLAEKNGSSLHVRFYKMDGREAEELSKTFQLEG
ncbi:metallophosphoesterase family protein [Alkalicoccus chagannorensis]|uniref:metallophosphoesterase family protein n=1 Tax=Alkalicoccus chagannorensis TaxID=427072 RepID=UPI00041F01B8|nr:metallophosphoesterase [Alkalicoccus chagannorensis]